MFVNNLAVIIEKIGDNAFSGCKNLISINIPDGVTTIGEDAFKDCTGLTSISIPSSISSIEYGTFYNCRNLTKVTIDSEAFVGIEGNGIGSNIKSINVIFGNQVQECILGEHVTSVACGPFLGLTNLISVTLSGSIVRVADGAFSGCTSLESAYNEHVFAYLNPNYEGTFEIPEGIESIAGFAFSECSKLTAVALPSTLRNIGFAAFQNCSALKSIDIPQGITEIPPQAFAFCSNLSSVSVPTSVTVIGKSAFIDTAWLERQPQGVVYAGKVAYCYSGRLPDDGFLEIKEGTRGIADNAFDGYNGLYNSLTSVYIPQSVEYIGSDAFSGCKKLETVRIMCDVPSFGDDVFNQCPKSTLFVPAEYKSAYEVAEQWKDFKKIVEIMAEGEMFTASISVGEETTDAMFKVIDVKRNYVSIGRGDEVAINDWASGKVVIPSTIEASNGGTYYVKELSDFSFFGCYEISSVSIHQGVTGIGEGAFYNCDNLSSVAIPGSVGRIGDNAFASCRNLVRVTMERETPVNINAGCFSNAAYAILFVPEGSVRRYRAAEGWKEFGRILEIGEDEFLPGDVDGDENATKEDVKALADFMLGKEESASSLSVSLASGSKYISLTDFLERGNYVTTYTLTGTVRNIANTTYGNFDLVDGDASIFIYGLLDLAGQKNNFANIGITEGDRIAVAGSYTLYNGKPEIVNAQLIRVPADVNGDGKISIADITALVNTVSGK